MKAVFIKPRIGDRGSAPYYPVSRMEPLSIGILEALTPEDVETSFYDDRIEGIPFDAPADLAAISVDTFTAKRAYEIADRFRLEGTAVVMGGMHVSMMPDEALEHADAVAVGAAEGTWRRIIEDFRSGRLEKKYICRPGESPPVASPRRDIFAGKKYLPVSLVESCRGCPNSCEFCSVSSMYGGSVIHRPLEELMADLESIDRKFIFITDDNLYADRKRTKEFLSALIPLKKRWFGQISIDFVNDPEICELMVRSGCVGVTIGFESLDRENLAELNKSFAGGVDYPDALERIRELGIMVYGTFIIGCRNDSVETFDLVLDFAVRHKLFMANFNHLMPYPGTPLYGRMLKSGRLLFERWWLDDDYRFGHAVFEPEGMTADELTRGCMDSRRRFNRLSTIIRRGMDLRANSKSLRNAALFFRSNMISRRDIRNKQDMILGRMTGREK